MALRAHARTLAIVKFLRAAAPALHKRRGGRIPRQAQPDAIRLSYFNALMPHIRTQLDEFAHARHDVIRLLMDDRRAQGKQDRTDESDRSRHARQLVEKAAKRAADAYKPRELYAVAEQFALRTSDFQRGQLDRQVRQAMGVPFSMIEKPTRDLIPAFAAENAQLVSTVSERYFSRLAEDVQQAFETGEHPNDFAERLVELDDMAESDARRIARDQIGKLNAAFNQTRQEAMGVTTYTWRTANDNRVRDNHQALEGQSCDWDDPPDGGGSGDDEPGSPGDGCQCRCYAEPNFDDIKADIEGDSEPSSEEEAPVDSENPSDEEEVEPN